MKSPIFFQTLALTASLLVSAGSLASAVVFSSQNDAPCSSDNRYFTLALDNGSADCVAKGEKGGDVNIEGSDAEAVLYLGDGWEFLDKDENNDTGHGDKEWTITGYTDDDKDETPTSGIITLGDSIWSHYDQLAIGMKSGNNTDPTWVIFILSTTDTAFEFTIEPQGGLSHVNLYGVPSAVPIPAALGLFGLGLAGLGLIRQRKQKHIA